MSIPKIMVVKEKSRKYCEICGSTFDAGHIVVEAISSSMGSRVNVRWTHLRCMLLKAEKLLDKEELCAICDEWLISQV